MVCIWRLIEADSFLMFLGGFPSDMTCGPLGSLLDLWNLDVTWTINSITLKTSFACLVARDPLLDFLRSWLKIKVGDS